MECQLNTAPLITAPLTMQVWTITPGGAAISPFLLARHAPRAHQGHDHCSCCGDSEHT
jgi:hypothetical protein